MGRWAMGNFHALDPTHGLKNEHTWYTHMFLKNRNV